MHGSVALLPLTPFPGVARSGLVRCVRDDFFDTHMQAIPSLDTSEFLIGTAEWTDLPSCIGCLMDGFYKDILTLAKDEFSEEEMEAIGPTLEIFNDSFQRLTRFLLTWEARRRLAPSLDQGGLARTSGNNALMLVLQERSSGEIVGVAEMSQQPCDGKVPGDIRLPRLPWVEADSAIPPQVAYLSNLAVRSAWRGRGLGRSLINACEQVARRWDFDEIYLHAATQQEGLLSMYSSMEYVSLPSFDQPPWVLALSGREPTRYHRKALLALPQES